MTVIGKKASDQDVVLSFTGGQISVVPKNGGSAVVTVPYKTVAHGTYIHSKDPRWDTTLPGPPDKLDMPGFIRTAQHWLTLQTRSGYVIIRLHDDNWDRILQTVEARTGIKIDRVADK